MNLAHFTTAFVEALNREPIPPGVDGEQDFKRRFVIPLAKRLDPTQHDVLIYSPPFLSTKRCDHPCAMTPPGGRGRVVGCPRCWAAMKAWGSVAAFGAHHTFDVVAKGRSQTLAVEVKLATLNGSEIQRFVGQCALAATKHPFVIGLFGYRGELKRKYDCDSDAVKKWFRGRNVEFIFRQVGESMTGRGDR